MIVEQRLNWSDAIDVIKDMIENRFAQSLRMIVMNL